MGNTEYRDVTYHTFITKDRQYVKVPDVKRWLKQWMDVYGEPPREAKIHPGLRRLGEHITSHSPTTIVIEGHGPLAFELQLGPVPAPASTLQSESQNGS